MELDAVCRNKADLTVFRIDTRIHFLARRQCHPLRNAFSSHKTVLINVPAGVGTAASVDYDFAEHAGSNRSTWKFDAYLQVRETASGLICALTGRRDGLVTS
jgi:hypothetical protein